MRLLIVEDDPDIAELLQDGLSEEGYECDVASSAAQARELARLFPYSALILDVMLPEGNDAGYELGTTLRHSGLLTPILYLTARAGVDDRVAGLDAGGDDYLTKPFAFRELRARLRALFRRASGNGHNLLELPFGGVLDLAGREFRLRGQRTDLTRREFALLELLALNTDRAFSREELIDRLWRGQETVEPKVIDVYVSTIRRKTDERLIETLRGTGYRLGRAE